MKKLLLILIILIIVGTISVSANIIERGINHNTYQIDDKTYTTAISTLPINYLKEGEYLPIDTKIVSSDSLWDYEVTKGIYQAYFKKDPSTTQTVKFQRDNSYLTFQPLSLNYRNDLDQIQQVDTAQSITGTPNENEFSYDGTFGNGISLNYKYLSDRLKENLIINKFDDLPQPEDYITEGNNPTLDLDFLIDYPKNTEIYINGEKWSGKSIKKTSEKVEFKVDDKTIFFLSKPYVYDSYHYELRNFTVYNEITQQNETKIANVSVRNRQLLEYMFKNQGSKSYIIIKTPYSFLQNAHYPITIDPTMYANISKADCGSVTDDPSPEYYDNMDIRSNEVENQRASIKFPLSSEIPPCDIANITNATLWLKVDTESFSTNCGDNDEVEVYRETTDSEVAPKEWSDVSTGSLNPLDEKCLEDFDSPDQYAIWDVLGNGIHGVHYEHGYNDDYVSFIIKIKTESLATSRSATFHEDLSRLNLTYFKYVAPNLSGIPDNSIDEDTAPPSNWIDLYPYASDETDTDDELDFTIIKQSNSSLISCSIGSDRYLNCGTPAPNQTGYSNVTVEIINTHNLRDNDTVRITVNPVNDPPSIYDVPDNKTRKNGDARDIGIDLWMYADDIDNNDSELDYSVISQTNITLINCTVTSDRFLTCYPPMANQTGYSDVTVQVNDSQYVDNDILRITVYTYNHPPHFENDTEENSTIESPTKMGNLVEFTADIQDNDNDTVRLLICDKNGLSGTSCAGIKFCSDPSIGNESVGPKSCTYDTTNATGTSYAWKSYACDNYGNCIAGAENTFYVTNVRNLTLYLENTTEIWDYYGYILTPQNVTNFTQELIDAQTSCTPDADGYCNISLDLRSETSGVFEIFNIQVYYNTSDNRAPIINVYEPTDTTPEVYEGSSLEFDHSSSDPDGDIIVYNWTLDNVQQSLNQSWTYQPSYGDAGYYNVTLVISDGYLTDSQSWNVTVLVTDNPPTVMLVTPNNNNVSETGNMIFNCSAEDDYNLVNITLYHNIDGTWKANQTKSITGTYDSETFTINNIPSGIYLWNCLAYDNSSQYSFADSNYSFSVTTAPSITLISPENNTQVTSDTNVTFIYIVDDPGQIVSNCSLVLNEIINKTDTSITENINQTFNQILPDGNYNWSISCYNDITNQGNSSIFSLNVTYNNAPIVIDLIQNETEIYQGETFEIRCLVNDVETANNSLNVIIEYQHGGDIGWHYCEAEWDNSSQWWECVKTTLYANYTLGLWDFRCNVSDGEKSSGWTTDIDTLNVLSPFGNNRFYIKDNSGYNSAFFDDKGYLVLRGSCTSGGTCTSSDDSFIIKSGAGEEVSYIDQYGNLCIETGDCTDKSTSCNPTNDAFMVKNETGTIVSYIDTTGDLCLTGGLVENGNP